MNAKEIAREINDFCVTNANAEVARKSQRYFKEPFDGYGLMSAQLTTKTKEMLASKKLKLDDVVESIDLYLIQGKYEELALGLLLLNGFSEHYTRDTFKSIETFFTKGITNWAHADVLGMYILPKFFIKKIVCIDDFSSWLRSPHKFQRRCAPVTFIKPMKLDKGVLKYIDFTEILMNDTEREVHQGMGWFLREAWKIDRSEVEPFLEKWKETGPRIIFQYACEKMTFAEKARFKRSKK